MCIEMGYDITKYSCGCSKTSMRRFGPDKKFEVSRPCVDCREKMIGQRFTVIRYGNIPECGKSYNYRDNKYEEGVSVYFENMRPRPEFVEGRNKLVFSAVVVGFGGDDEPLIDVKTIIK